MSQAKELKRLEVENAHLKRVVADLTLDNQVLKDAAEGNFQALNGSGVVVDYAPAFIGCRSARRVSRLMFRVLFSTMKNAGKGKKRFVFRRRLFI